MYIVIAIIVIVILIGIIKAVFEFIAEHWKPIFGTIAALIFIGLTVASIIEPYKMYGFIIFAGGALIITGAVLGVIGVKNIFNNIEVTKHERIITEYANFLLQQIQELSAVSDTEAEEILCTAGKSKLYMHEALGKLYSLDQIRREKLNKDECLYINNTPVGEQMDVIEISLD